MPDERPPTLADVLQKPQEEYVGWWGNGDGGVAPHVRAFGAGLVDPFGIPSRLMRLYADNAPTALSPVSQEDAKAYRQTMRNARDESPLMGGAGSGAALLYPLARLAGWGAASGAPLAGAQIANLMNGGLLNTADSFPLSSGNLKERWRTVSDNVDRRSALKRYGDVPSKSELDEYGNRRGDDAGIPPLPGAPY